MTPRPSDIAPPVWLFISGCTAYDASIYHGTLCRLVADYFTKALQGLIFRQLRDMIMGNTDIALPTDEAQQIAVKTSGIPAVLTQPESRSVLKKRTERGKPPRSLTVLPAYGKANEMIPIGTSKLVLRKRTLTWADVASGRKRG